jgi:TM2 domain-containing membrane protein YozV
MVCYVHPQNEAVGACVGCGKFICKECATEINGRNYCKKCLAEMVTEKDRKIDSLESKASQQPMVFMNAGGGAAASSSSSSSSGGGVGGGVRYVCTKSKVAAGILALFLGGLGIHKFYLGKAGMGILYILFSWTFVPAVVAFIEGIILLCTSDEVFNAKYGRPVAVM